ncbi:aminoacylase-1A [Harpegnathos saltator]|nr:aminoacylase-1A [Harpegnathos saltator]
MAQEHELSEKELDEKAVEYFREYLRIPSVQPNAKYEKCVEFILTLAESFHLPAKVYHLHPGKPVVIIAWEGTDSSKSTILLNNHMDVVTTYPDKWLYPPFSAHMDEDGNIYARGSQDMKSVGMQYLEAIHRFKLNGKRFSRTVYISFMPEEEVGGEHGMKDFVQSAYFKSLNVGFALDEGNGFSDSSFHVTYIDKAKWSVEITCEGVTGHGSLMLDNTAAEKMQVIVNRFLDLRAKEKTKLDSGSVGDVTSVNLTKITGGVEDNIIPQIVKILFDIRLAPSASHEELEAIIQSWCKEAGTGVTYKFCKKNPKIEGTKVDDTNPFWMAFKKAADELDIELKLTINTATSDARFLRQMGIPVLGFSPINETEIRIHADNEYLNKKTFLRGIEIYTKIIPAIANV